MKEKSYKSFYEYSNAWQITFTLVF